MANEPPKKIKITKDSELGKLVDEARYHPVLVEKDGAVYSISLHSSDPGDLRAGYDPEKVRDAIRTYGGSWKGVDAAAMSEEIYASRDRGSRPAHRP